MCLIKFKFKTCGSRIGILHVCVNFQHVRIDNVCSKKISTSFDCWNHDSTNVRRSQSEVKSKKNEAKSARKSFHFGDVKCLKKRKEIKQPKR